MRPALWLALFAAAGTALAVSWLTGEDAGPVVGPATATASASASNMSRPARAAPAETRARGLSPAAPGMPALAPSMRPAAAQAEPQVRAPWPELDTAAAAAWMPPPPPAPPPPAAPAPAPAPPVPPFPYQWLGLLDDGGKVQIFLDSPQRTRVASAGEVLDQRWRIDGVVMGQLQVTWLPTGAALHVGSR